MAKRGFTGVGMPKDTSRQRLRPWLESVINSNEIEGLEWTNKELQQFKIPWKHGGKHDWTPGSSRIFMEWARHTGRYRPGIDDEDYATWKTRLRCAFNKAQDIEEVKELTSLNSNEPYRVYRLIPKSELVRFHTPEVSIDTIEDNSQQFHYSSSGPVVPVVVQELSRDHPIRTPATTSIASISDSFPRLHSADLKHLTETIGVLPTPTNSVHSGRNSPHYATSAVTSTYTGIYPNSPATAEAVVPVPNDLSYLTTSIVQRSVAAPVYTFASSTVTSSFSSVVPSSEALLPTIPPPQLVSSVSIEEMSSLSNTEANNSQPEYMSLNTYEQLKNIEVHTETVTVMSDPVYSQTEEGAKIELKYQGKVVRSIIVPSRVCCRVTSQSINTASNTTQTEQLHGDPNIQELLYPDFEANPSETQSRDSINALLPYLKNGVIFEEQDGDIYATRYCKCGIHYISAVGTNGLSQKLMRVAKDLHKRIKIFDYHQHYQPAFERYQHEGGVKPEPSLHLLVGQTGTLDTLDDKIYISMTVTSLRAEKHLQSRETVLEETMEVEQESFGFQMELPPQIVGSEIQPAPMEAVTSQALVQIGSIETVTTQPTLHTGPMETVTTQPTLEIGPMETVTSQAQLQNVETTTTQPPPSQIGPMEALPSTSAPVPIIPYFSSDGSIVLDNVSTSDKIISPSV